MELVPALPVLAAFLAASFVLAVTPGPGVFYIVTRSINEGREAGLASVVGVALGNFGSAVAASVGLAAILSASSVAFEIVRYLGALFVLIAASTDTLYALLASRAAPYFSRANSAVPGARLAIAGAYLGLGLFTVLAGNRGNR
jgi:threonine/homoserine/homoserine lactone efflux protein